MALHKLERRNYGGELLLSIKYQNLHSFKKGLIPLCQSILEMRQITHLHGSAHLKVIDFMPMPPWLVKIMNFLADIYVHQNYKFYRLP